MLLALIVLAGGTYLPASRLAIPVDRAIIGRTLKVRRGEVESPLRIVVVRTRHSVRRPPARKRST